MITLIKALHTAIWIIMTASVFYIGYSVFRMNFDALFVVSLILIGTETVVILVNAWTCPLTNIARRYTSEDAANFDIYLPKTLARYNKEIFSFILFVILLVYVYNVSIGA